MQVQLQWQPNGVAPARLLAPTGEGIDYICGPVLLVLAQALVPSPALVKVLRCFGVAAAVPEFSDRPIHRRGHLVGGVVGKGRLLKLAAGNESQREGGRLRAGRPRDLELEVLSPVYNGPNT